MYIYVCESTVVFPNYKSKVNIYGFSLNRYQSCVLDLPIYFNNLSFVTVQCRHSANQLAGAVLRLVGPVLTSYLLLCSHSASQLFATLQSKESGNKVSVTEQGNHNANKLYVNV
jgi:hypothetical protein